MTKATLELIVHSLNETCPYLVTGDLAVAAYGAIPSWFELEIIISSDFVGHMDTLLEIGPIKIHRLSSQEFDAAFARRITHDLSPGTYIPICSYTDLVEFKSKNRRSCDAVDLHHLELVRNELMHPTLSKDDPWARCTYQGDELFKLLEWSGRQFADKVRRMEHMHALSLSIANSRRRLGLRSITPTGEVV